MSGSEEPRGVLPEWKAADLKNRRVPRNIDFSRTGFRKIAAQLGQEFRRLAGLGELLESAEYDLVRVQRDWEKIAGPLAAFSYPSRLKEQGQKLEVLVENSVYSQELSLYQGEILKKLKFAGIPVERLYIKVGAIPWDRVAGKSGRSEEKPANPGLADLVAGMKDSAGS